MKDERKIIKQKKKQGLIKVRKKYLLPFTIIMLVLLILYFSFDKHDAFLAALLSVFITAILQLLFDISPSYVYHHQESNEAYVFYLLNPLGKTSELKYSKEEIGSIKISKKKLKDHKKIYIEKDKLVKSFFIIDPNLTFKSFKFMNDRN